MRHPLTNLAGFQLCWLANVLGAANALPWAGPLLTAAWLAAHLAAQRGQAAAEARLLLAAAALGWLADSTLVLAGLIAFPDFTQLGAPSPLWMVALWVAFAATLRHSLGWLRGRWLLGAALGAAGGPMAYLGGQALGAIEVAGTPGAVAVSVQYALATPALLALLRHLERDADGALPPTAREVRW